VKREGPRFLDEPAMPDPATGRNEPNAAAGDESSAVAGNEARAADRNEPIAASPKIERPRLHDPLPDAPNTIGTDWRPERVVPKSKRFGAGLVAVAGIALIIAGWLATSMTLATMSSFQVSPVLGDAVVAAFAVGGLLVLIAIGSEWRAMRSLRQVETVRSALRASGTPVAELRSVALRWLRSLPGRMEVDPTVLEAVQRANSADEIVSILRNRVGEKLTSETRRIGLRVATEGSLLVAISPHQSWDGIIVALYGLRIVRQVAVAYGLRPSGLVTVMLLRRTLRAALEIAAVQFVAQGAGARILESTPLVRHLVATVPGLSTSELRLYRLAVVAGDACNPLAE
jgi:uncharacterized membrane protein YcjF (UPF0283 family)